MIEGIDVVFVHIQRDETVLWYRDVLGLAIRRRDGHWTEFESSPNVRFALDLRKDVPSEVERQAVVASFRVRDAEQAVRVLASRGVKFHSEREGILLDVGTSLVATFRDPEGNWLQLSQPKGRP